MMKRIFLMAFFLPLTLLSNSQEIRYKVNKAWSDEKFSSKGIGNIALDAKYVDFDAENKGITIYGKGNKDEYLIAFIGPHQQDEDEHYMRYSYICTLKGIGEASFVYLFMPDDDNSPIYIHIVQGQEAKAIFTYKCSITSIIE